MAVIERSHCTLLVTDGAILLMQPPGLPGRQLALAKLVIDAPVLVLEPIIDLIAARVVAVPRSLGERAGGREAEDADGGGDDGLGGTVHADLLWLIAHCDRLTMAVLSPIAPEPVVAGT